MNVIVNLCTQFFLLTGSSHETGIEPFCSVMQRFPAAIVIDAGPGSHRPAVIKLPVDGTHAPAPVPSPVLHAVLNRLQLENLGNIGNTLHILRILIVAGNIGEDLGICKAVLLMRFHDLAEDVLVLRKAETIQCLLSGE